MGLDSWLALESWNDLRGILQCLRHEPEVRPNK